MDFISKTIAPAGRNKYGGYYAATNITKSVISTTYGGNSTTTTIADTGTTENNQDNIGFYAILTKTSTSYDALDLPGGINDSVSVIAYRGYDKAPTLICDLSSVTAITEDDIVTAINVPANMGVLGIPNGMTISFTNNGTSGATMNIHVTNSLSGDNGKIEIPVVIYKRTDAVPVGDDVYDWWDSQADCEQIWLDLYWRVNRDSATPYFLDLSNQSAGVNCDTEGNIYSASTATLTCSAFTYLGETLVTGVTYERIIDPSYNAHGVSITSINGVGVLSWAPNFDFLGDTLPIDIVAKINDNRIGTKTMSINKNYPGVDGTDAHTRWVVTDADVVRYNPNDRTFSPNKVTGRVMLQVGSHAPVFDSGTTIYEWVNEYDEWRVATSAGTLTQNMSEGISAVTFALYSPEAGFYEQEDVPVISNGLNGATGPQGPAGENGASAASVWVMTMTNDNASVNAKNDGTIPTGAVRPTNKLKLWYGEELQYDARFAIDYWMDGTRRKTNTTGMNLSSINQGVVTLSFSNTWSFTADTAEIVINAYDGDNELRDTKVMSLTKSRAGSNGSTPYISGGTWWIDGTDTGVSAEGDDGDTPYIGNNGNWWIGNTDTGVNAGGDDGVSYFLIPEYDEIIYDPNTQSCDPANLISCECYKQVGESTPVPATDVTIKYRKQNRLSSTWTSYTTMPNAGLSFNAADCVTYKRFRFGAFLTASNKIVDQEDIDILMNGTSGLTGGQGRTGAAIRGPYDYYAYSGDTTHYWYDGKESTLYPEAERWIDVVLKDDTYYYCVQSYRGNLVSYINNTNYWSAGTNFDFVAANLIMANNAKIKFLSGNEIYLMSGNTVTAGLAGGSGITFWSGAEDPDQGLFKVDADGGMSATTGLIGGWYYDNNGLQWADTMSETDYGAGLSDDGVWFTQGGMDNDLALIMTKEGGIYYGSNNVDARRGHGSSAYCEATLDIERTNQRIVFSDGVATIPDTYRNTPGIHTNMEIYGHHNVSYIDFNNSPIWGNVRIKTDVVVEGNPVKYTISSASGVTEFSTPVMNPFGFGLKMAVITSDISRWWVSAGTINGTFSQTSNSYFTAKQTTDQYHHGWFFNNDLNMNLSVDYYSSDARRWYSSYRYLILTDSTCVNYNWKSLDDYGIPSQWVGMWCGYDGYSIGSSRPGNSVRYYPTGIYGSNFTNKKGDTIYFNV